MLAPSRIGLYRFAPSSKNASASVWPATNGEPVAITPAQMGYLLEAIDWRNPRHTWRPASAG
jgi:hypothetical protein